MPLSLLNIGEKARIVKLTGHPNLRQFLTEHGFSMGKCVEIIQQTFGDNLIIKLDDTRMAINRKIAHHVHINMI